MVLGFYVITLRLVADKPLFSIYEFPVGWPASGVVNIRLVFWFEDMQSCSRDAFKFFSFFIVNANSFWQILINVVVQSYQLVFATCRNGIFNLG